MEIFCLRFRSNFCRHTKFLDFWISKKNFFLIWILGFHGKVCRLFPCIPIFKGFFLLKVQKECVYVIMLKIELLLFKIYVLMGKKGISGLVSKVAAKPSASY